MRGGRKTTERAQGLRREPTGAERTLWYGLRYDQLGWRFRRQFPIPPYIVDFACPEAQLVVECDGGQHAEPGEHDRRDAALRRQGWRVLRFWNNDILQNRPGVLQRILEELGGGERKPSPASGGGKPAQRAGGG
jgi:very-short-patch-repair endonuclease